MKVDRRERPRCRKVIEARGYRLLRYLFADDILNGYLVEDREGNKVRVSDGILIQLRKIEVEQ